MILARPPFQLRSLPIPIRWEVTRRHPYYQIYWRLATRFHAREPTNDKLEMSLRLVAVTALAQINVTGPPPPPQTSFAELGEAELKPAWLAGAVHPLTLRHLTSILLAYLPKDATSEVAELFRLAAEDDVESEPAKFQQALSRLPLLNHSALDSYPTEPFVSINPAASERQVIASLNPLIKQWKAERGLGQKRDRSENFEEFLKVWDQREGWSDGSYSRNAKTLRTVAQTLQRPNPTVTKQYRRAFELITGCPYSPEAWLSFFGVLKLSRFAAVKEDAVSKRRPMVSPTRRDVPESALQDYRHDELARIIANIPDSAAADGMQLRNKVIEFLKEGKSDDEILGEMNLEDFARPAIEELRSHFQPDRTRSRK